MDLLTANLRALWPRRLSLRIRTRIALLMFALAGPFIGYSVMASLTEARVEREHVAQQMLGSARVTAARLDDYINDIRQLLRVLSTTVSVDPAMTRDNDAILHRLDGKVPAHINNLTVWAANGDNIGAMESSLRTKTGSLNLAPRKFIVDALAGAELTIEGPARAISNNKLIAIFSIPIMRGGKIVGVVAASTQLTPLQQLLTDGNAVPPGAVVAITDISGVVLARSIDPEKFIGRNLKGASKGAVGESLRRKEGTRFGPSADGVDRVAGFTMARAATWLVYVGVPTDLALAAVHERLRNNLLGAATALLFGLLLAYLVGEGIAEPLRQLSEDAEKLGQGELSHRSRVNASGEVGTMAATLNTMAAQLQDRSAALIASEHRMQMIADNIPALVSYVDAGERYRFVNAYTDHVFGAGPGNITGRTIREVRGQQAYSKLEPHIRSALAGKRVVFQGDWPIDGVIHHYQATYVPDLNPNGEVVGFYALTFDVSEMKRTQNQLDALARADTLTGLANRREFEERLRDAMARTRRTENPMAVVFLDIDHFKAINDTHGHAAGDQVLKEFAKRLTREMRSTDLVARFAGDEFVILLEGVSHPAHLKMLAFKIVEAMREPFAAVGEALRVTTSVGVASYHGTAEVSVAELIGAADEALYEAKRAGRDRFVLARPALQVARPGWQASRF